MSKPNFYMWAIVIALAIWTFIQSRTTSTLVECVEELNKHDAEMLDVLEQRIEAGGYKINSMLYLMNTAYGDADVHKMLADSCKSKCVEFQIKQAKP